MIDPTVRWREHYSRVALILLVQYTGNLLRLRPATYTIFVLWLVSIGVRRSRMDNIGSSASLVVAIVRIIAEMNVQIDLIDLRSSKVRHVMVMLIS